MPSDAQRHDLLVQFSHEGRYVGIEELFKWSESVLLYPLYTFFVLFVIFLNFDVVALLHVLSGYQRWRPRFVQEVCLAFLSLFLFSFLMLFVSGLS